MRDQLLIDTTNLINRELISKATFTCDQRTIRATIKTNILTKLRSYLMEPMIVKKVLRKPKATEPSDQIPDTLVLTINLICITVFLLIPN